MYEYINAQWFTGNFDKWQIFRNKPGFANTNSNVESFNNVIKRDFTNRRKLSVKAALDTINEIITYYSNNDIDFAKKPNFNQKMLLHAKKLSQTCFKKIKADRVSYKGERSSYMIKLNDRECYKNFSCNCRHFLKKAVCPHLLGYSMVNELNIYNENEILKHDENFVKKNRKGRHCLAKKALLKE